MPVDEVTDLLAQWREASGVFSRGRVIAQAVRTLGNLTPDERRTLGRALAQQGAPGLAEEIEDRSGGALGADHLTHVADGLLSMDDDQIDGLLADLRDPDARQRLAHDMLDRAAGGPQGTPPAPPVTGPSMPDVDLSSLPPPGSAGAQDIGDLQNIELDTPNLDTPNLDTPNLDTPDLGTISLGAASVHDMELGDADVDASDQPSTHAGTDQTAGAETGARGGADDHRTTESGAASVAAAAGAAAVSATRADETAVGSDGGLPVDGDQPSQGTDATDVPTDLVVVDGPADPTARDLLSQADPQLTMGPDGATGATTGAPAGHPGTGDGAISPSELLEHVRTATTATDRLAIFGSATATGRLGPHDALAALDAVPAGWQRRRAAERLAETGALPTDDLPTLFRRFDRSTDAAFVAGTLLATRAVAIDDLDGVLPARTVRRLATRTAR